MIYTKQEIRLRNKKSAKKLRTNQRSLNNPNELAFKYILFDLDIKNVWQKPFYSSERFVCVDFYLPGFKIVIEIDGPNHNKRKKKDQDRTYYLKRKHKIRKVLRFTNHQVRNERMEVINILLNELYGKP